VTQAKQPSRLLVPQDPCWTGRPGESLDSLTSREWNYPCPPTQPKRAKHSATGIRRRAIAWLLPRPAPRVKWPPPQTEWSTPRVAPPDEDIQTTLPPRSLGSRGKLSPRFPGAVWVLFNTFVAHPSPLVMSITFTPSHCTLVACIVSISGRGRSLVFAL
jgi:hypothetical protein